MDARTRRVGGGFPGYNGPAHPRAMRTSRGRGQSSGKTSGCGQAGFFDLLATVAGQILQEDTDLEDKQIVKLTEKSVQKKKCSDTVDVKNPEVPVQIQREPSAALGLQSLVVAVRNDEYQQPLLDSREVNVKGGGGDMGADSVHSVVNKAFLSRLPSEECPQSDEKSNSEHIRGAGIISSKKNREVDKQMTSSVSDNDEKQTTIKSDPDSSISTAKKHSAGFKNELAYTDDDAIESLQTPKAEEVGVEGEFGDEKEVVSGIGGGNEQATDMEIDFPKSAFIKHLPGSQNPISSTVTDIIKAELSSGEVTHLHSDPHKDEGDETVGMDVAHNKKEVSHDEVRIAAWNVAEFYGKEDDGESGLEVDDKSRVDAKKPLKVADVILGKVEPNIYVERGYLENRHLPVEHVRERMSSKDSNCGSSKQMLRENASKKLKDSYTKGMRARKVVKMVKRSRVSSSRSKRKHADMEAAADSDEGLTKKTYYGGLSYTRQRTSRGFPVKRKKMVEGSSTPRPDLHVNTTNLMDLGFECVEGEPPAAAAKLRSAKAASVASSPTSKGCTAKVSKKSGEPHVKLTIKSFTVPELSVDLPESATVSSLKRAVMDAAMNLLGGGLRVRVLLQGKKVPDEAATLAQVGISRAAKPDSLGFMLEPSPVPTSPTSTNEDPLLVLSRAAGQPSPRFPVFGAPGVATGGDLGSRCPKTRSNKGTAGPNDGEIYGTPVSGDHVETKRSGLGFSVPQEDGNKVCSVGKPKAGLNDRISLSPHSTRVAAAGALAAIRAQADASRRASKSESESSPMSHSLGHESLVPSSGAIILHSGMNSGESIPGLALVPVRQKPHSLDVGKRRVRRPFSVSEVEALVHAVEKLGTGRWRDVKLRAFDQAKHRTYVDLKDKWKTLVHTARIAPHQRRGEPVPQELLERVTRAHTYWTAQAAKQQAELDY